MITSSPLARYVAALSLLLLAGCSKDKTVNQDTVPATPTNLTARAASPYSVVLEWNDNSNNETSFVVWGPSFALPPSETFEIRAVLPADSYSFVDTSLVDSTEYSYYVIAANEIGNSQPSDTVSVTTMGVGHPPMAPYNPSPADGARNVDIAPVLTFQCSDPDGDDLNFHLYFGVEPDPPLTNIFSVSPSFALDSLDYSTTYFWRVMARDGHPHETLGPIWSFTTHPAP